MLPSTVKTPKLLICFDAKDFEWIINKFVPPYGITREF